MTITYQNDPWASVDLSNAPSWCACRAPEAGQASSRHSSTPSSLGTVVARTLASAERIHAGDPDPPRIFALDGSVCPYRLGSCVPALRSLAVQVNLAKPRDLCAGKDVMVGDYRVRGDTPDALSRKDRP